MCRAGFRAVRMVRTECLLAGRPRVLGIECSDNADNRACRSLRGACSLLHTDGPQLNPHYCDTSLSTLISSKLKPNKRYVENLRIKFFWEIIKPVCISYKAPPTWLVRTSGTLRCSTIWKRSCRVWSGFFSPGHNLGRSRVDRRSPWTYVQVYTLDLSCRMNSPVCCLLHRSWEIWWV